MPPVLFLPDFWRMSHPRTQGGLACGECLAYPLLDVFQPHLHAEFTGDVLRQMLCGVDRSVPATRASAGEHQGGEASLHVAEDVRIRQSIDMLQEVLDFIIGL